MPASRCQERPGITNLYISCPIKAKQKRVCPVSVDGRHPSTWGGQVRAFRRAPPLVHGSGEAFAEFADELALAAEKLEHFQHGLARGVVAELAVPLDDPEQVFERLAVFLAGDIDVRELHACVEVPFVRLDALHKRVFGSCAGGTFGKLDARRELL